MILKKKRLLKDKIVIAVDFDHTLYCGGNFFDIGEPNFSLINFLRDTKKEFRNNAIIILNTCRQGEKLQEAIDWCEKQGLNFDYINENCKELIDKWGDCRKIAADIYIDDRAVNVSEFDN